MARGLYWADVRVRRSDFGAEFYKKRFEVQSEAIHKSVKKVDCAGDSLANHGVEWKRAQARPSQNPHFADVMTYNGHVHRS